MLIPEMTLGHLGVMEEQIAEMSFNAANVCEQSRCCKSVPTHLIRHSPCKSQTLSIELCHFLS